ncbi:hypothetical protein MFRU_077g00120 [Monilinia fructicola]|uniref:Uncharacterized protein n=1 Tax=Monilinia fructicola TaxID=38448 RepID=A0A5M9J8J5_MONFR|nr:hypothetical protein EYC84_011165 [Monilinia fructicola]KAG4024945.1 hypothetical protein MFRU_077g00120 [Monilinia fructicola]
MKLTTLISILAATLVVALPAETLTRRENYYCVTQGPGTCTFGWQEFTDGNGHFSSEARIYDNNCIQKGSIINDSAADQFMTVKSADPPMTVSINGWASPPQIITRAIPKFDFKDKTWGGADGCTCGAGVKGNFWGCRCAFDCP